MKAKLRTLITMGCITFLALNTTRAAPIILSFNLPEWDVIQQPTPFGSNATVNVTVDNGSSSFINQSYRNADIIQIDVASGPYFNSWLAADIIIAEPDLNVSYLSIDNSGVPVLDLTISGNTRVQFENEGGIWQFGTRDWSGPTTTWLEDAPGFNGFYAFHNSVEGFLVTGSIIPEPMIASLILTLLPMMLIRRIFY